ncbi:hypothetical protein Tco_1279645, partial [Tanacetum coccineum]
SINNAIRSWGEPGGSLQLVRETLAEYASPMLGMDEEDLDLSERNLKQCKRKICDGHYTTVVRVLSSSGVSPYNDATLQELKAKHPFKFAPSFPDIPIHHHQLIPSQALVLDRIKSFPQGTSCGRDGLRAQHLVDCLSGAAVAISDELVSSITQVVNLFLDGKCPMRLGEYIASAPLIPLVKPGGGIRPIAVGTFWRRLVSKFGVGVSGGGEAILHAVNHLVEDHGNEAWYLDDGTIIGDTLVVGKVLELIMEDGPRCGLHLNVGKTEIFWPKEDRRCRVEGAFPPNVSRPLHGVKLLGGAVSVDFGFSSELVMKRVSKTIELMDAVAKINDPQCELMLLRACTEISKLYFAMRTCPPRSAALHTKLLRHVDIVASGPTFDDALYIYFTRVTKDAVSTFSLSSRQMALWKSQMEDHTSDWLRAVPISGLGQTMNACSRVFLGDIYGDHAVLCAGIIGIKHRHNVDGGRDVCVDLTGSSPLTQTGMADFVSGRVVLEAAQRKRAKYEAKCADIGYGFLPFSFSSFRELEKDVVTLLKRIRNFSVAQDIRERAAIHIFSRIRFAIAKGARAQIVSRLPSNLL